ncbi:hypothetical protein QF002_005572 [Paraburkholderia youngii]
MKTNRTWMIGALVLTGAGLTGVGAVAATAEDVADGAAIEVQHHQATDMQPAPAGKMAHEMAHDTAMQMHHHHDMTTGTVRSSVQYTLPAVTLVRDDGQSCFAPRRAERRPSGHPDVHLHELHDDMPNGQSNLRGIASEARRRP